MNPTSRGNTPRKIIDFAYPSTIIDLWCSNHHVVIPCYFYYMLGMIGEEMLIFQVLRELIIYWEKSNVPPQWGS